MPEPVVLEAQDVSVRFGGVMAVNGVDFTLRRGELRCLIGPNGAGKSTFFKCLTGVQRLSGGEIRLRDERIDALPPHQVARLGVGVKTQTPSMMAALTVREHVWLAAHNADGGASGGESRRARVARYLRRFGVDDIADARAGTLAHGQRQLAELAMVAAGQPSLILLDEPAAGMTEDETRRLAELVSALRESASVIVVEHDMSFVRAIADYVTVFHQGRVLTEGGAAAVLADERVRDIYLGRET